MELSIIQEVLDEVKILKDYDMKTFYYREGHLELRLKKESKVYNILIYKRTDLYHLEYRKNRDIKLKFVPRENVFKAIVAMVSKIEERELIGRWEMRAYKSLLSDDLEGLERWN